MIVVLDTNVLVSGLLSPFGPSGEIVRMASSGELTLCLEARILAEYHDVLRRPKFKFDSSAVEVLLDAIQRQGIQSAGSPLPNHLPDRDDEPFLEAAIAGGALRLVTGNIIHYPERLREGIIVESPAEFLAFYKRHQRRQRP